MSSKNGSKKKGVKELPLSQDYLNALAEIKSRIQEAQFKSILAINKELIKLYWYIGKTIVVKQEKAGWGAKVIERLAKDLQNLFPGIKGFSRANIFRMRSFYLAYEKVSEPPRQFDNLPIFSIPWWHNVILITHLKDTSERFWYAQRVIESGWSGNALESNIKRDLYHRDGKAINNFEKMLPSPQSVLAQQSLKDPYLFDFLMLGDENLEHDIEKGLIENVQKLLLELGKGFAFVGRQYHLEVGESDFYIDLLFYHCKLHCYVVVELKSRPFDPRDTGQLSFYLSVVDDALKQEEDRPTIGLLLCKTKDNIVAEYALKKSKCAYWYSRIHNRSNNETSQGI